MKNNLKDEKITSGVGIAIIVVLILKATGFDIEATLGLEMDDAILYLALAVSSIIHLISKDPTK